MSDKITQYFNMMSKLHSKDSSELTKAIIRDEGLPELMTRTSSLALKKRIAKEISNGKQGNQHAG